MLGTGIKFRLQSIRPATAQDATNIFDLRNWEAATGLTSFGLELFAYEGAAKLEIRKTNADGVNTNFATLEASYGSDYSPPILIADHQGAAFTPQLAEQSEHAKLDMYFGTNETPRNFLTKVVFAMRCPADQAPAIRKCFDQFQEIYEEQEARSCAALVLMETGEGPENRGWLHHVLDDVLYGQPSVEGYSHIVFADIDRSEDVSIEHFLRPLSLARYLKEDVVASQGEADENWPWVLFDLMWFMTEDKPQPVWSAELERLERSEMSIVQFAPLGRTSARTASPHEPNANPLERLVEAFHDRFASRVDIRRLDRKIAMTRRKDQEQLHRQIRELRRQLQATELLNATRVRADFDRTNRVMLSLLRNRHQGQRAVVIGNGPSLNISDLERLHESVTFASNKIYLAYDQTDWRPTYYSVEDHLVLVNNWDEIHALEGSVKIFPASVREFGYDAADTIMTPFRGPKSFADPLSDPAFPAFSSDLSHGTDWGSTITYTQIQMAVHMGCTEIVLIGLDHSYVLPKQKEGDKYISDGEQNHFHPEYRQKNEKWHRPNLDVLEKSYSRANEECLKRGIRIVNASRRSELDVFEKADFDVLFDPS